MWLLSRRIRHDDLYRLDEADDRADETDGSGYDFVQLYADSTSLGDGIELLLEDARLLLKVGLLGLHRFEAGLELDRFLAF